MNIRPLIIAIAAAALPSANAFAQQTPVLLPDSIRLSVVEGSTIPTDCMYPEAIADTSVFEIGCVTMPRYGSAVVAAEYIGQLGELGWHQGQYVTGGMTAERTDENNCRHVLNIFPGDYPPTQEASADVVLWFALDRTPRCPT
ncbi:MAG: hypothetical protein K2X34_09540 [Hyphomonadaceae bacterium]|nr:hypothetical protein [Hyphomonadaceae bacterium]